MKTNKTNSALCGLISVVLFYGSSPARAGLMSEYYLTAFSDSRLLGVQGSSILFDSATSPAGQNQGPIAVNSTVRTLGWFDGNTGGEYNLSGAPMGATYPFPAGLADTYDGTTNGTSNFAWDAGNGIAYQFSDTWTNPTALFTLGTGDGYRVGITHDASNDSLWISCLFGDTGNKIEDYSLSGVLLSSFTVAHNLNGALALDPADGTLWLNNRTTINTSLTLEQYSKTGTLLDSLVFTGVEKSYNVLGGEFQIVAPVPEPGTALLLLGSGAMLLLRRRRAAAR